MRFFNKFIVAKTFFCADTEVPVGETDEKVLTRSSNPGQKQPTIVTGKR